MNNNMIASSPDLGPTYHDFSCLGLPTEQIPGIYAPNQRTKVPIISAYILMAFARLRARGCEDFSFAELFCADGFYAMFAARFGAACATGFDNDRDGHLASAAMIRDRLGLPQVEFRATRIEDIPAGERFDVVANVGGLYHVDDPEAVLEQSYEMARAYLVIQNVVSLATDAWDYFERPAPGLDWGNRFSRASFDGMVRSKNWRIVDSFFNTLDANPRLEDRGSVYYLIEK